MDLQPEQNQSWPPNPELQVSTKSDWRSWAKAARPKDVVSPHLSTQEALVAFVVNSVPKGSWIVGYQALAGEYDVSSVLTQLDSAGWPAALVRTPDEARVLTIHPLSSKREKHRFGFTQPAADAAQIPIEFVGAVFVPGLAFDRAGTRLGFGAGYFDRFLVQVAEGSPLIGLATLDPVERLPSESHDIPMTHLGVHTESGFAVVEIAPTRSGGR